MSAGSDLIRSIARRQNLADYQKKHWTGSFAEYLDIVKTDPKVTRTAYQRLYDMILSKGTEEIVVNKEKLLRYKFFDDPDRQRRGRHLRARANPDEPGQHPQERRARLRHRTPRAAAARPGGQFQEHASPGCSRRGWSSTRRPTTGRLFTYGWQEEGPTASDRVPRMPDARGAAAPDPPGAPGRDRRRC